MLQAISRLIASGIFVATIYDVFHHALVWTEDASDARYPPGSKSSSAAALELRRKSMSAIKSTPPDNSIGGTTRRGSALKNNERRTSLPMSRKVEHKKPSGWKLEIASPGAASLGARDIDVKETDEKTLENARRSKPETRRSLFSKNCDEKMQKSGGVRSGSRVAPYSEDTVESTALVSNNSENLNSNHKECEDLSSIRNQLVQIEKQQSSLLDLIQVCFQCSKLGIVIFWDGLHI